MTHSIAYLRLSTFTVLVDPMKTWAKVTIAGVSVAVVGFAALAGTGAYYVFRHLDTRSATEADTRRELDVIRTRFKGRPPLIEVVNPRVGDIRINRIAHPDGRRVDTLHVLTWNRDEGRLLRTDVPLWLMRFSSVNVLSHLGVAPERFRLTVEDIRRYGPGIVVDYGLAGRQHLLIWVE
jgi:hypothetical protein